MTREESDSEFLLAAVAEQVLQALPKDRSGPVEVVGEGSLAVRIRRHLADSGAGQTTTRPSVIVETTGSPDCIVDALQRLDDLGTLVLTRETHGCDIALDLYADLHLRSLTIVGLSGWRDIAG
jgi:hypothetical protein